MKHKQANSKSIKDLPVEALANLMKFMSFSARVDKSGKIVRRKVSTGVRKNFHEMQGQKVQG